MSCTPVEHSPYIEVPGELHQGVNPLYPPIIYKPSHYLFRPPFFCFIREDAPAQYPAISDHGYCLQSSYRMCRIWRRWKLSARQGRYKPGRKHEPPKRTLPGLL